MLHRCFALVLFTSLVLGCLLAQAQEKEGQSGGQTPEQKAAADFAAQFPPDTPVVTFNGLCDTGIATGTPEAVTAQAVKALSGDAATGTPATGADCKTVITRERFERLAAMLNVKPARALRLAYIYADMLGFAGKGNELGVQKTPRFQEKMRYDYLQALAQQGTIRLQEIADDFTDADLEKFYKEHPGQFVEIQFGQLAIPKKKNHEDDPPGTPAPTKQQLAAEQAEMKKVAERLQRDLAAGGNIDKLEEKAYKAAHDASVPDTDLGPRTPDMVPDEFRKMMFDLQLGQVSALAEDDHEYLVLKAVKRRTIPLDDEARHHYGQLRMKEFRKALSDAAKMQLNDKYFEILKGDGSSAFMAK